MAKNKAQQRARAKHEREKMMRKQQERARRIRTVLTVLVVVVVGVTLFFVFKGNGRKASALTKPSIAPSPAAFWKAEPNQCGPKACYPTFPLTQTLNPSAKYTADIVTNYGTITVALNQALATKTVQSFVFLATHHFYDGLTFHRVIPNFMIQGGDPKGNGTGGPGYEFDNENDTNGGFNGVGVLAMANSGPNTNGSQFFITVAPQPQFDKSNCLTSQTCYSIFGQVIKGQAVVVAISKVKTDSPQTNKPIKPVIISKIVIHTTLPKAPAKIKAKSTKKK
ncbi:MAG: peptidylprolyl isomerase [Actinomycetota bacterium]